MYCESKWNDADSAQMNEQELLLYRSNCLGADLAVTNFGGGNTSAKVLMPDPLKGEESMVLWVKGSGGDLGSMELDGFSTLYQDKLLMLEEMYRGLAFEDEMVGYLPHCTFELNPRAASIDTPLHAYLPFKHIDHMHPDSVIAIAAARNGEALTADIFDGEIGWLPWQRPGFDLALRLRDLISAQPELKGVVLGGHGLFTWGETSRACYDNTLWAIDKASKGIEDRRRGTAFGGPAVESFAPAVRRNMAASLMPAIRSKLDSPNNIVGHFADTPEVLEFVNSTDLTELAELGTSCPDHFLRTKIKPLVVPVSAANGEPDIQMLDSALDAYRRDYAAYYERCKDQSSPAMRGADPVVFLVPGVGMITFAKDKPTARIAAEFYTNAINVMRDANAIDEYVGLDEQEAFNIEYWALEEAKLQRMPPAKPLAGRIAMVTGGAGGIGAAVARRFLTEGACVVLADINETAAAQAAAGFAAEFGSDRVRYVIIDVTDEDSVAAGFSQAMVEYGGIDILVANAGIASAASIEDTSAALWDRNFDVLAKGYFLTSRDAFRIMKRGGGGSIVFVGSKNALVASAGAAAYSAAKASELHLARCIALEGAACGIRVNSVNPDAVLSGSRIWSGDWRKERADAYGIGVDELEVHYQQRSLLKLEVLPQNIAEAVYFFASDLASRSTGNIMNVDAGNAAAFTR